MLIWLLLQEQSRRYSLFLRMIKKKKKEEIILYARQTCVFYFDALSWKCLKRANLLIIHDVSDNAVGKS